MNPEVGNIGHGIIGLFIPTVMGSSLNERADPLPGWSCLISSLAAHTFLYSALFLTCRLSAKLWGFLYLQYSLLLPLLNQDSASSFLDTTESQRLLLQALRTRFPSLREQF